MSAQERNTYLCLLCGTFFEAGPGTCSLNLHYFEPLSLNAKGTGYIGHFQQGGAHYDCVRNLLVKGIEDPQACAVCGKHIEESVTASASKLAIYIYRKKGCTGVIGIHDECFRKIKCEEFPFIKLPKLASDVFGS